jgi:hypothetical protein
VGTLGARAVRILRENWLFLLVIGGILAAFLFFRTTASEVGSIAEVDAILQSGQPALVEFYSNT